MLSYSAYKIVHVTGLFLLYAALGAFALGSSEGLMQDKTAARKLAGIAHGIALIVVLIGGMGLLARLGMGGSWPLWVWLKIGIWLILGGITALMRRKPSLAKLLLFLIPLLGSLAGYLALYKPGSGL